MIEMLPPSPVEEEDLKRESASIAIWNQMAKGMNAVNSFPEICQVRIKRKIFSRYRGKDGDAAVITEYGVAVEFWDGGVWSHFIWDDIENAEQVKREYATWLASKGEPN